MVRTSIVLAIVAAGLLAFILFFERGTVTQGERDMRQGRVLDHLVKDRTTRIELQRKGVTVVLTRGPDTETGVELGSWSVEKPYPSKADQDAVDSVLSALEWINARRTLSDLSSADVAQFGLDKPRYRMKLLVGREEVAFSIGSDSPDGAGTYMRVGDAKTAYVVTKDVLEALNHDPEHFHTKQLYDTFSIYAVRSATFKDGSGERRVEKRGEEYWLQKPETALASEAVLNEVISALDELRATRYVSEGNHVEPRHGFDAPTFEAKLDMRTYDVDDTKKAIEKTMRLRIGAACAGHPGESYARVGEDGPILCVNDADVAKAKKPAPELREARMLLLEDSQIHGATVTVGKRQLVLTEDDEQWRYKVLDGTREVTSGIADGGAVSDWFKQMRSAMADRFTPAGAAPLTEDGIGAVSRTLRIQRAKDKPAYEVRFGRRDEGRVAAKRDEREPLILWFSERIVDVVSTDTVRFRKLRLLSEDTSTFSSLRVVKKDGPAVSATREGKGYRIEPTDTVMDRSTVDEIVRVFSSLEAIRFVFDSALPEHGLADSDTTLVLEYKVGVAKPVTHELRLGAQTEGGRYAQLDKDPAVFVAPDALISQLPQQQAQPTAPTE